MNATSWAVLHRRYGGPEVLAREAVPVPPRAEDEVLVRVVGTSVNRLDLVRRSGALRLHGWGFPKGTGFDLVGIVEEGSPSVPDLPAGTAVWGILGLEPTRARGTVAEYVALRRDQLGILPDGADPDLAALPLVAATALAAIRDRLHLLPGQSALVVGASGGVGTAALQVLRELGVRVDAVAASDSRDLCAGLGAERVFAYDAGEKPTPGSYDGVLVAGGRPADHLGCVRDGGRVTAVAGDAWLRDLPRAVTSRTRPRPSMISVGPDPLDLDWLGVLAARGALRPIVEQTYPVTRIADAHRDQENGRTRGKRVVLH